MQAVIYVDGQIGSGKDSNGKEMVSLVNVVSQFKAYESADSVLVKIDSVGGSVKEADKIFDYLKSLELPLDTEAKMAFSAAAKLFSLGENREVENKKDVLMIHLPWGNVEGNAEDFEVVAVKLREIENNFSDYYSEFLGVDKDTAMNMLKDNTYFSAEEAVNMGFATGIKEEFEAVALFEENKQSDNNKMNKKEENKKNEFLRLMGEAFAVFMPSKEKDLEVKALVLQDSNATEINFPDLEEGDTPKVGDKAEIDGSTIPDGSYIMPSLENATVVFEGGVITEIIPKEEEEIQAKKENEKKEKNDVSGNTEVEARIKEIEKSFQEKIDAQAKELEDLRKITGSKEFVPESREQSTIKNSKSVADIIRERKSK